MATIDYNKLKTEMTISKEAIIIFLLFTGNHREYFMTSCHWRKKVHVLAVFKLEPEITNNFLHPQTNDHFFVQLTLTATVLSQVQHHAVKITGFFACCSYMLSPTRALFL